MPPILGIPGYNEPFPSRDAIVDKFGRATRTFTTFFENSLLARVNRSPFRVQSPVNITDVSASDSGSIATDEVGGLYRVTAYVEVLTADPVSSSLTIELGFTHNGKAMTREVLVFSGAPQAVTDNEGGSEAIDIDAGTPISYTLTYASNTPGLAVFEVSLLAELLETN